MNQGKRTRWAHAVRFNEQDAHQAYDKWGFNCGPAALAAILRLTIEEVRRGLGDFEQKRYMNPTMMYESLQRLGVNYQLVRDAQDWPEYGLVRIQWHGPWMQPEASVSARYRHTHWVGAGYDRNERQVIFDLNAISEGGWVFKEVWTQDLVPWLLKTCQPKANGQWSLATVLEVY